MHEVNKIRLTQNNKSLLFYYMIKLIFCFRGTMGKILILCCIPFPGEIFLEDVGKLTTSKIAKIHKLK